MNSDTQLQLLLARLRHHEYNETDIKAAWIVITELTAARATIATLEQEKLVPGVVHCARCKFRLNRVNLYVQNGTTGPGDSKTEPCPNGCGPLWPVSWEQEARDAYRVCETQVGRALKAEQQLAAKEAELQALKQPVRPTLEQERRVAEHEYSVTAFDYCRDPIGSDKWCLYWAGWLARSTATITTENKP